jgi:alkanesulfonate monooxygenase SsuD/methylene tetrahydromethanopterin reductase-like flavin-dependent oxidoreductase (luciferase family)
VTRWGISAYNHPTAHGMAIAQRAVASSNDFSDTFVFMGAVLATTRRLTFAAGVHVMPLRHPLLTARALTTAAEIGPGRIILGVGAGWMQEEFDALDVPFAERGPRLDEGMAVLRDALDGVTTFDGQFYRDAPSSSAPNRCGSRSWSAARPHETPSGSFPMSRRRRTATRRRALTS